jgi:GT2 family glycosyltransferase
VSAVDVVIVSYNSRGRLRACVEPLASAPDVAVVVVDNASTDDSLSEIEDLPVVAVARTANAGFATACNEGWRLGTAPFVLFLNPDARLSAEGVQALVAALERAPKGGAVGPRIVDEGGELDFSQRRFPGVATTFAQALFLHHLFPRASWTDEVVRDRSRYGSPGSPDWVSGACLLVRRSALEAVNGWDGGFFLYGEDKDLCRRLRLAGYSILFEPSAVAVHAGGGSGTRAALLPLLAWSRLRFARKHSSGVVSGLHRIGITLGCALRVVISRGGVPRRRGQALAAWHVASGREPDPPSGEAPSETSGPA